MNPSRQSSDRSIADAVNPWMAQTARIQHVTNEGTGISTYELRFDDPAFGESYRFEPGQFNMLYLPGIGEAAISISSDANMRESLWHTVRIAGNVTLALSRLHPGDQLALRGPFGSSWPVHDCLGCDVVIACGGIGLAPLRPVIYHMVNQRDDYGRVILLYGSRTPKGLLYKREFDAWRAAGIEVEVTVDLSDADWNGHIGVVPALFTRLRLHASQTRVLTCGPEIMMRFIIFEALGQHVAPRNIYLSMERNMNCAIGFCGHCQLGPAFVCKDGPVFTYEKMEPYLHLDDL